MCTPDALRGLQGQVDASGLADPLRGVEAAGRPPELGGPPAAPTGVAPPQAPEGLAPPTRPSPSPQAAGGGPDLAIPSDDPPPLQGAPAVPAATPQPAPQAAAQEADALGSVLKAIGQRESSDDYSAVNDFGFVGRYQMGAAALEDAGYVRPGTAERARELGPQQANNVLRDSNVWTGKDGVKSRKAFLKSTAAQDAAARSLAERNLKTLERFNAVDHNDPEDVAGMLMAAHLVGARGAAKWRETGVDDVDGYGTSVREYYELGRLSARRARRGT